MKKRGKMHIFSPVGKKYAYLPPIDLKFSKWQKKADNFSFILNFIWGKNINKKKRGGGGKNMAFFKSVDSGRKNKYFRLNK